MSQFRNLIARLCNGTTAVPSFLGRPWRETGTPAVRSRVVRQPELLAKRREGEPIAGWVVVAQQPAPRTLVPIGAIVTLRLQPTDAPAQTARGPLGATEAAASRA